MKKETLRGMIKALVEQTEDGLFPLVGYALEKGCIYLLTTNIPDLALAIRVLKTVTGSEYNLGHYIQPDVAMRAARENPHVFRLGTYSCAELELNQNLFGILSNLVVVFGAPYFPKKAVGLIDICGFSQGDPFTQLADLYSLENIFRSNVKRCAAFTESLGIPNDFGYASTGDGFYCWHDTLDGRGDTATLLLLLCIIAQTERFREEKHYGMRLRAAYVVDSLFMIYDADDVRCEPAQAGSDEYTVRRGPARNVVGVGTNIAARLCAKARPSQILLGQFERPGQGNEVMNAQSVVAHTAQLFRQEFKGTPAELDFDPDRRMCVTDKHKMRWHCWNLIGKVPNRFRGVDTMQRIGLRSDDALSVEGYAFDSEPWGKHEL